MSAKGPSRGWSNDAARPTTDDDAWLDGRSPEHVTRARPASSHDDPVAVYRDPERGERLQKVLGRAGLGSRRACEALIEAGEVRIDGRVVDRLPIFVDLARDRIDVRGKRISLPERHVYVMLFKPRGVLSTNEEDPDRRRAVDLVNHPSGARLFPVGRLDVESSGLLLLTTDGALANRITHPRYGIHKTYEVTVDGHLDEDSVAKLERGVFLSDKHTTHGRRPGRKASASRLKILKADRTRTRLRMELHEGRNRQIRRMMLYVGHKVRKLRRIAIGPLELKGVRPGEWRDLSHDELKALRRAVDRAARGAERPSGRRGGRRDRTRA